MIVIRAAPAGANLRPGDIDAVEGQGRERLGHLAPADAGFFAPPASTQRRVNKA